MHDFIVNFLITGWLDATWWQVVIVTLVLTHITIASVTIFLHRAQAHLALKLGPVPSHFFRLWLWLTTGMITKEWVAIHRKHHAKCETTEDPHSPVTRGIKTVFWRGSELYRAEAKIQETLDKYGHNTPDDWFEHHLYSRHTKVGIGLMLVVDVLFFGVLGVTVWAVQMLWIPIMAAGVINGIGHYWGYRNFETPVPDASTNILPWGIVIGGEELHNNHHTYPTSAKLSVKPWEFDIGWVYIRALELVGWATVRKVPPQLTLGSIKLVPDEDSLRAVIAHRYELMAEYAALLKGAALDEVRQLRERGIKGVALRNMQLARRCLHRDSGRLPVTVAQKLRITIEANPRLAKLVEMRETLRQLWVQTDVSVSLLACSLEDWCDEAEGSGIVALVEFARRIRAVRA